MNCLIYSRVSTDEQAQNGRSIDDQIRICEKFANENDYKVTGTYKDPGKSATNMNRPALQDLLIRSQEDKSIEAVLVQDTDRLARNPSDHLQIKALLKKNKVKLISISQPMTSGDDPESNLIDLIIAGVNAFQSQITGRKTSKVMEQKVLEGWLPGPACLGYKNSNKGGKNIIEVDQERKPYLYKLFNQYASGARSLNSIKSELDLEGFRTKRGLPVAKSVLFNILKNPFYTGVIPYKDKIYPGNHEAIIPKDLFDRCQQVLQEHNQFATRTRKYKYLLRGILFCAGCGSRIYAEKHFKPKEYNFYYCQKCGKSYVDTEVIEKQVALYFKKVKLSDRLVSKIISRAKTILHETHNNVDSEKRAIDSKRNKFEIRRSNLETKFLDGEIDKEVYKRQHELLNKEIGQLQDEFSKLDQDRTSNIKIFEQLLNLSKNIYEAYLEADQDLRKQYLAIFWQRFEMKDGRIEKAVPTKVFQALLNQDSFDHLNSKVRISTNWLPGLDSN